MRQVKNLEKLDFSIQRFLSISFTLFFFRSNNKLIPIPVGVIIENETATRAATIIFPPQNPPGSRKLMAFEMVVWPDYDGFSYDRNEVIPPGM